MNVVHIQNMAGDVTTMTVPSDSSTKRLEREIMNNDKTLAGIPKLLIEENGIFRETHNADRLEQYGNGRTYYLVMSDDPFMIIIHFQRPIFIEVTPHTTIAEMKMMIGEDPILAKDGTILEDHQTARELGLREESVLDASFQDNFLGRKRDRSLRKLNKLIRRLKRSLRK
jgi:hypothetical protein